MNSALAGTCKQIIREKDKKDNGRRERNDLSGIECKHRQIPASEDAGEGGERVKKEAEIKVKVDLTPGYEKRFTAACLEIIKKREIREEGASA